MAAAGPEETTPGASPEGEGAPQTQYKVGENALDAAAALNADAEDEAMRRYKESLGITADGVGGQLKVVVHNLTITPDDGHAPIVIPLSTPGEIEEAGQLKLQVKQGVGFTMSIEYTVSGNPVLGMRFVHKVNRMGMNVSSDDIMLGGYPAKAEPYQYSFPPDAWPTGMFARANYSATVQITDEDGTDWVSFPYEFKIAKNWE